MLEVAHSVSEIVELGFYCAIGTLIEILVKVILTHFVVHNFSVYVF